MEHQQIQENGPDINLSWELDPGTDDSLSGFSSDLSLPDQLFSEAEVQQPSKTVSLQPKEDRDAIPTEVGSSIDVQGDVLGGSTFDISPKTKKTILRKAASAPRRFRSAFILYSAWKHKRLKMEAQRWLQRSGGKKDSNEWRKLKVCAYCQVVIVVYVRSHK